MITLSTLCGVLPQILIPLFVRVWIDRYSRKGIVMITDCLIASAALMQVNGFTSTLSSIQYTFNAFCKIVIVDTKRLERWTVTNCGCIPKTTAQRGPVKEELQPDVSVEEGIAFGYGCSLRNILL